MQPIGSAAWRSVTWLIVVGLVFVGVGVGLWRLHWWMFSKGVNYQAHIYEQSYGAQSAYLQQLEQEISEIRGVQVQINAPSTPKSERSSLQAQLTALSNQACSNAGLITSPLPVQEAQFVHANC